MKQLKNITTNVPDTTDWNQELCEAACNIDISYMKYCIKKGANDYRKAYNYLMDNGRDSCWDVYDFIIDKMMKDGTFKTWDQDEMGDPQEADYYDIQEFINTKS